MTTSPSNRPQLVWPQQGGQDFLQLQGEGGNVLSWIDSSGFLQGSLSAIALSAIVNPIASSTIQQASTFWELAGNGATNSFTPFNFPAMLVLNCTGCQLASDVSPLTIIDTNAPTTNPFFSVVMKSNGQVELVAGNNSATSNVGFDLQVSSAGLAELTGGSGIRIDTINGPITLVPGGGAGGTGTGVVSMTNVQMGPIAAQGTGASLTGTGACATFTATATAGFAGAAICSGVTGAATIVITPPAGSPTPGTTLICWADDTTHLIKGIQSGASTSTCTVSFSSVTTGDFLVLHWEIL